jgi:hypothetical protein
MKKVLFSLFALFVLIAWTKENSVNKGGRPLVAELSGGATGDPDGSGIAKLWLNQGQGTIEYEISVENISTPTASHIHYVSTGSIAVPLAAPVNGYISGVVENVDPEIIKDIRQNPEDYYVNVHNADYPAGAVSGILSK